MSDLDDVTTSVVDDDATKVDLESPENLADGVGEVVTDTPDGFAIRDAKIAELESQLATAEAALITLRAHNYDLLMAANTTPTVDGEPENSGDNDSGDNAGVDSLFKSKDD